MNITNLDYKSQNTIFTSVLGRFVAGEATEDELYGAKQALSACGVAERKQAHLPAGYRVVAVNPTTGVVTVDTPEGLVKLWVKGNSSLGVSMVGSEAISPSHPLWAASWA